MTLMDNLSPAGATLDQIHYAQEHIEGNEDKNCKDNDDDSKDWDCKFCSDDDDDDSESPTMLAAQQTFGGGNFLKEETAEEAARLFKYSNDDYNHLDDDYLNEDER
jgi:hypothetical protein